MTLTIILATVTAICPAAGPQDSYPVGLLASCPAPVTGLLYPLDHEDQDARLVRSALGAARSGEECAARLPDTSIDCRVKRYQRGRDLMLRHAQPSLHTFLNRRVSPSGGVTATPLPARSNS